MQGNGILNIPIISIRIFKINFHASYVFVSISMESSGECILKKLIDVQKCVMVHAAASLLINHIDVHSQRERERV
jgi:hypothetical protein